MNVAIYLRVSTQEQSQEGFSIPAQKERLVSFCKAKDYVIYDFYIDGGWSGSNLDRPAMQKMIEDVQANKLDAVIVYKLDRLSRSQKDTLYLIEDVFLANNTDLISMQESFDTSTPFGRAMIGILAVFAQLERESIKERSIMGKRERARSGKWKGGVTPFGYDYVDEKLIPNENAPLISKMYEMYLKGDGTPTIATALGIKNPSSVSSLLSSVIYTGYISNKGELFEGDHEAIVSYEDYLKVQKTMKTRGAKRGVPNINNPLAGLLTCKRCGARYSMHKSSSRFYYRCCSRAFKNTPRKQAMVKDPSCENKHWKNTKLEALVFEEVFKVAYDDKYFLSVISKKKKSNVDTEKLELQINDINKKINKMMDLYLDESMQFDAVKEKIKELNEKKKALIEIIESEKTNDVNIDFIRQSLSEIKSSWNDLGNPGRRELLARIIKTIRLDGEGIKIEWLF